MPQLATRVLKDAKSVDHSYVPTTKVGNRAVFTDRAEASFQNQSTLTEETRPVTKANEGHKLRATLALPHPVQDQEGCCVDKDAPAVSYINIDTLASKRASGAQLDDLIALTRSYVASAAFADLVKGGNNW